MSAAPSDRAVAGIAALTPLIWGTTYLLTTQFLPPGRPLLIALGRSLPTGAVLVVGSKRPPDAGGAGSRSCRCCTAPPSSRCCSWRRTGCPVASRR